jgi:hypothetical protein
MPPKKKYIVLARNGKIQKKGLMTGKGHRVFGQKSALWISDPAEAREIETQYGMKGSKDVAVTTDQQYEWSLNNDGGNGTKMDNIHHYVFQGVDMSRIRTTKDNGFVWAERDGKQVRMKHDQAIEEGLVIVPQKKVSHATRRLA